MVGAQRKLAVVGISFEDRQMLNNTLTTCNHHKTAKIVAGEPLCDEMLECYL